VTFHASQKLKAMVEKARHGAKRRKAELPAIPAKRYFTIGEVSELWRVKPHVLRYWEQEFTQLKPVKRRGNRAITAPRSAASSAASASCSTKKASPSAGARQPPRQLADHEDKPEPARSEPAVAGAGVDLAAIKRELRAVLEQLQGLK